MLTQQQLRPWRCMMAQRRRSGVWILSAAKTCLQVIDPIEDYLKLVKQIFDFGAIKVGFQGFHGMMRL